MLLDRHINATFAVATVARLRRMLAPHMRPVLVPAHKRQVAQRTGKRTLAAVRVHVHLQRPLFRVLLVAHLARIPDPIVRVQMSRQMRLLPIPIRAAIASVRLLAGVLAPMQNQIRDASELLVAIGTLHRFAGVQSHVRLQDGVLRERLATHAAHVRPFARVQAHVTLERIRLGEHLAAHGAVEWSLAGVHAAMGAQPELGGEAHRTVIAGVRSLAGVRVAVDAQSLSGAEAFAAGGAQEAGCGKSAGIPQRKYYCNCGIDFLQLFTLLMLLPKKTKWPNTIKQ